MVTGAEANVAHVGVTGQCIRDFIDFAQLDLYGDNGRNGIAEFGRVDGDFELDDAIFFQPLNAAADSGLADLQFTGKLGAALASVPGKLIDEAGI